MRHKATYLIQEHSFDLPLLLVVVVLVIFGLIIVYDASVIQALQDFGDGNYYIRAQLIWVVMGVLAGTFFTLFDFKLLQKLSGMLFLSSLGLLLAVFIPGLGTTAGGAHRWLNLGFATIQPAEIIKLTAVIWLSTLFSKKVSLKPVMFLAVLAALVLGVLQKDLGSTIVFVLTVVGLYVAAGGTLWQILLSLPAGGLVFAGLVLTSAYRKARVLAFLNPFADTQGSTYHISQVLIALGSGGWTGLGLGQSRQKFYIPEVTTDSIFGIVGEELGFLGALFLISLFVLLIHRGFKIASRANDPFGKILATGLTLWLGIQAIVNLGSMVSLMPLTGVPLPFISYGGSALVVNLVAIGILLNISKKG